MSAAKDLTRRVMTTSVLLPRTSIRQGKRSFSLRGLSLGDTGKPVGMAKGEGRMTESEGKGPEGKGPGAASRLPDIMLCSAGGGGGGGREVDLDRKLLEQQLPDVMLCSWTASVLMDRRRERRRHPATVQTPGRCHVEEPEMEPLVQDMELLGLHLEEEDEEEEEEEEEEGRGDVRRKTGRQLEAVSSTTTTPSKIDDLHWEDTPSGVAKAVRRLIKPFFQN